MAKYLVRGKARLQGEISLQGAKNAALPILAAALLCDECVLHNCPKLTDIDAALHILECLGCRTVQEENTVSVYSREASGCEIPYELMQEMRSSIVFLGAIVARHGRAVLSRPGGCELGPRPIDLHLSALEQLGVSIREDHGFIDCRVPEKLRGAAITLPFPSVGATENILLAACLAEGETVIHNPAREPEIADLIDFLTHAGAQIAVGPDASIHIQGVKRLHAAEHRVIPDRIAAATYLCCAAITRGEVLLRGANPPHLQACLPLFEEMGCQVRCEEACIFLKNTARLRSLRSVRTMPYPGFPTDAQAPFMSLACVAAGTSVFVENIFENRYKHAGELARMGAHIRVEGRVAVVEGCRELHGATLACTDLRGGAALVTAALAAEGESEITGIKHIERGYENFDTILAGQGAMIQKLG